MCVTTTNKIITDVRFTLLNETTMKPSKRVKWPVSFPAVWFTIALIQEFCSAKWSNMSIAYTMLVCKLSTCILCPYVWISTGTSLILHSRLLLSREDHFALLLLSQWWLRAGAEISPCCRKAAAWSTHLQRIIPLVILWSVGVVQC